ncbi:cell division protein SepF [Gordonia zhaorongruii]|uniref:cell division protein SepF n=1 Tax=Gordonia zhaorongruii TaxID=2597659 RepID=UPI0010464321|nr:cell division protein SepF [Gordonia zhaorongruii]
MTTMQKFKAYFGMVPPSEYEDDYFDEPSEGQAMSARERAYMERYRSNAMRDEPFYDDEGFRDPEFRDSDFRDSGFRGEFREPDYRDAVLREPAMREPAMREPAMREPARFEGRGYPARAERPYGVSRHVTDEPARGRLAPLDRSTSYPVRGANAVAPEPRAELDPLGDAAGKISTLRPADYSEARTIGERYRDGNPVIMDLADMSNDDAKRLVDFAAGLAFAARGSLEKVATKVFLLSPAGIDVTPEQRRRIVETGFSNQS